VQATTVQEIVSTWAEMAGDAPVLWAGVYAAGGKLSPSYMVVGKPGEVRVVTMYLPGPFLPHGLYFCHRPGVKPFLFRPVPHSFAPVAVPAGKEYDYRITVRIPYQDERSSL
jgi:hypothetical protein